MLFFRSDLIRGNPSVAELAESRGPQIAELIFYNKVIVGLCIKKKNPPPLSVAPSYCTFNLLYPSCDAVKQ